MLKGLPIRFRLIGPLVSAEVLNSMPENVDYEGATFPSGVADAMRGADLFVLPTLEDSFALVVFEAMACGLPVITTTQAGSSEMLANGVDSVVIPPGNAALLAEAIKLLLDDSALRHRIGIAGRSKVQVLHSWDVYGQQVLAAMRARRETLEVSHR
jgi:glycosyltransferase involved in cell wall biosynthesis